jgi:hypothetical protein
VDQDAYDDLLQRLTALVIKMDESLDELKEFNREQQAINREQQAINREQQAINREQQAINQTMQGFMAQQIITNQRLETLLERAWRSRTNGQTD